VVSQLREPIDELRGQLAEVAPLSAEVRRVVPLLPAMLGADGPRRYLLMFQNNAEERASGGNPASLALLTVDKGAIGLGRQAGSGDFPSPYATPPYAPSGGGNKDWPTVYTDYASTYLTNITMTPDFPTTARMARAMWREEFGGRVDGVISFDPVALSYLLRASGPVELADGTRLDADNAVSFLLSEVYATYPDADVQDAVFASAARTVFDLLIGGDNDPQAYLDQLRPMIEEQRLKVWINHRDEQAVLGESPVGTAAGGQRASHGARGLQQRRRHLEDELLHGRAGVRRRPPLRRATDVHGECDRGQHPAAGAGGGSARLRPCPPEAHPGRRGPAVGAALRTGRRDVDVGDHRRQARPLGDQPASRRQHQPAGHRRGESATSSPGDDVRPSGRHRQHHAGAGGREDRDGGVHGIGGGQPDGERQPHTEGAGRAGHDQPGSLPVSRG
jgi:hypothetical protein